MKTPITWHFESRLQASPERVWEWITSIQGISAEMWPYFRMTVPRGLHSLNDLEVEPGERLFRSYVFLFGFLPIDYSDMTLVALDRGRGFVEESPMGSMSLWRHARRISPLADDTGVLLVDELIFSPRVFVRFVAWFIKRVFTHRHEVIRANLG